MTTKKTAPKANKRETKVADKAKAKATDKAKSVSKGKYFGACEMCFWASGTHGVYVSVKFESAETYITHLSFTNTLTLSGGFRQSKARESPWKAWEKDPQEEGRQCPQETHERLFLVPAKQTRPFEAGEAHPRPQRGDRGK